MRPKVICHMIGSIDGRLLAERWTALPDGGPSGAILEVFDEVAARFAAGGWLVGRRTMQGIVQERTDNHAPVTDQIPRTAHKGAWGGENIAVAVDPQGRIRYSQSRSGDDHLVAILSTEVPDHYLVELQERGVSYVFAGESGSDLDSALQAIHDTFGTRSVLLEGGGVTNGAFLKADLIDEISLLVYPGVDGLAGIPSIFEYHGAGDADLPAAGRSLRLLNTEVLRDHFVWLHYAVERP